MYDGVRIGSAPCARLREGRVLPVSITIGTEGVTLIFDGATVYDRHPWTIGSPWAPQPWWQLAFSAASAEHADNHWIDDLTIVTGTPVGDVPVSLTVALNGQQFFADADALGYTFDTSRPPPPPPPPMPPDAPPPLPPAPPEPPAPPSVPSPPASPPPLPVVSMAVIASGTVDDYTLGVQTALRSAVAVEAGVATNDVALEVEAASVRLTTITFPSERLGNGGGRTGLDSPAAAGTFLSTSLLAVTVESVVSAPAVVVEVGSGDALGDMGSGSGEIGSGSGESGSDAMSSGETGSGSM